MIECKKKQETPIKEHTLYQRLRNSGKIVTLFRVCVCVCVCAGNETLQVQNKVKILLASASASWPVLSERFCNAGTIK
jgi:hypothetical protein